MVIRSLLAAFLLTLSTLGVAQDVYTSTVVVADRSESTLATAAGEALRKLLIKVSGSRSVLELPEVQAAVADARNRLSLYTYDEANGALSLSAQFDVDVIKRILRQAGATFWGEDRPPVLLWMVVDEPYARRFATLSDEGKLLRSLSQRFEERGVRLRLPLMDLTDAAALSPEMVWQKVRSRVLRASARYGTEHILLARYIKLSDGQRIIDWNYLGPSGDDGLQKQGNDVANLLQPAVDLVVDSMAEEYAITLQPVTTFDRLVVAVEGVESFTDYQSVLALFKNIAVLDGVRVAAVKGDQLLLHVSGISNALALQRLIPARSRLAAVEPVGGTRLNLRWSQP